MDCLCCFTAVDNSSIAYCSLGCIFCTECIRTYVKTQLGKLSTEFKCMSTSSCIGTLVKGDDKHALGQDIIDSISKIEQSNSIRNAGIENLYTCPKCPFTAIYNPEEDGSIFMCPQCNRSTCSLCKKTAHYNRKCKTKRLSREDERRKRKEEKATAKVTKECPKCKVTIHKTEGCNRVKCICGVGVCWMCGKIIATDNYHHFDEHYTDDACQLFDEILDHVPERVLNDIAEEDDNDYYDRLAQIRTNNIAMGVRVARMNIEPNIYYAQTGQEQWNEFEQMPAPIRQRYIPHINQGHGNLGGQYRRPRLFMYENPHGGHVYQENIVYRPQQIVYAPPNPVYYHENIHI